MWMHLLSLLVIVILARRLWVRRRESIRQADTILTLQSQLQNKTCEVIDMRERIERVKRSL